MAVPTDFAGLQIWLDASTLSLGSLASWPDLSGQGHTGVMAGSPNPTVVAAPGDLPGQLPVVQFTHNEGRVRTASLGVTTTWTLLYVARMQGPTAGRIVGADGTVKNLLMGYWNGFEDVQYDGGFPGGVTPTGPAYSTDWKLYSADCSGSSGDTRLYSGGSLVSTVTGGTREGFGNTIAISGFDLNNTETSDCQVAEVVLYDNQLSDANRGAVETYLQEKWLEAPAPETTTNPIVRHLGGASAW